VGQEHFGSEPYTDSSIMDHHFRLLEVLRLGTGMDRV
jgi:hypothetical protein